MSDSGYSAMGGKQHEVFRAWIDSAVEMARALDATAPPGLWVYYEYLNNAASLADDPAVKGELWETHGMLRTIGHFVEAVRHEERMAEVRDEIENGMANGDHENGVH